MMLGWNCHLRHISSLSRGDDCCSLEHVLSLGWREIPCSDWSGSNFILLFQPILKHLHVCGIFGIPPFVLEQHEPQRFIFLVELSDRVMTSSFSLSQSSSSVFASSRIGRLLPSACGVFFDDHLELSEMLFLSLTLLPDNLVFVYH